jgi:hypothetical protein
VLRRPAGLGRRPDDGLRRVRPSTATSVADDAADILASVAGPAPVERLRCPSDMPFFARQQKIVLENSGVIDPDSFKGYVAVGGYSGHGAGADRDDAGRR